jgi:hypothetical protein
MTGVWTRLAAVCAVLASSGSAWALDVEIAARDIAVQLRSQGFACENPREAMRDASASKPDQAVWTIQCDGQKYRVLLVPDMEAKVERID